MISYELARVPVRDDLVAAHQQQWDRLARPGTWWSGAQRVAIAHALRAAQTCALCRERKASLSPYTVEGEHRGDGEASAAAIDVVHRLTTDPERLSKEGFGRSVSPGLANRTYGQIVGRSGT